MPIRWVICPVIEKVTEIGEQISDRFGNPKFDDETGEPVFATERWVERYPKIALLVDPGAGIDPDTGRGIRYSYSIAVSDGLPAQINNWCLAFVRGMDMSGLDGDPEIINILERDYEDLEGFLALTARDLGWPRGRLNKVLKYLEDRGIDVGDFTLDTALWEILQRLGRKVNPGFSPKGTWVR